MRQKLAHDPSYGRQPPWWLVWGGLVALACVLGACSLSMGGDEGGAGGSATTGTGGEASQPASVPTVWIREPANGAQVAADQPVYIQVETDSTATSFTLNDGGRVVSSVALPEEQSGPSQAILRWTPAQLGTYNLEVIAYNERAVSAPAALVLTVTGVASGPAASAGPAVSCTARVMVSQLNFRDGPGTENAKLGQFSVNETAMVIGRSASGSWYQVQRVNGQQVWVINNPSWFQVEGVCDSLPVVG